MWFRLLAVGLALASFPSPRVAAIQDARPLPPADAFFKAARERLASNAVLQQHFTYKERRTDLGLNPFGRMGTGPVEVFQVYPSVDEEMTYRRLIERDGVAISAEELAEQDREYVERYTTWRRDLAAEDGDDREARLRREREARQQAREQAREVLGLFAFTIEGRSTLRGQPAVIVQFSPLPDAHPSSREGRVAQAFRGRAWVHETEHELMQLEGTSTRSVAFGFGVVARLHEGARVTITRTRVNGTWLPDETRFSGTGRALLFRRVTIEYVREYFDYRPFDPTEPPPIAGLASQGRR